MATYEQLSKQFGDLLSIYRSVDRQRFIEAMYVFEEALNESRASLKGSEMQDLDTKFGGLVERVLEQYFAYKEHMIQQQKERGETPPNETQVGECIENTNEFKEQYPGFRSIRGDGNCYYRAVMVGLMEQIIMSPDREKLFLDLRDKFERIIGTYDGRYDDKIIPFSVALTEASRGECWNTVEDFNQDLRDFNSRLDAQMIQSARCLNAVTGKRWVLEDLQSLIDDDTPMILKLGQEAEGICIQAFPKELGIEFDLVWPQEHRVDQYPSERTHCFGDAPGRFKVSLLYTTNPGHYDLLYAPEQYQQLTHASVVQPIQSAAISPQDIIDNFLNYVYHHSPLMNACKNELFEYIRACPETERELIQKKLKEGLANLHMIGQVDELSESFFIRLQQQSEEVSRVFTSFETAAASSFHRTSIFRSVPEDYRSILKTFMMNPKGNQEHFNGIVDHIKTLSPGALEQAMDDVHEKIKNMQKSADKSVSVILNSALQRLDLQVLGVVNPEGLTEFRENLKRYVSQISIDPRVPREALLESIIMSPQYVQESLHHEVSNILVSYAKKHPNMVDLIKEEFELLKNFISSADSVKMRK
jgi:hypothetical protein